VARAVGDGVTENTAAFASAISACGGTVGGIIEVPAGTFVTGAIQLTSGQNLQVDTGATITFTSDTSKYPKVLTRYQGVEVMNFSPPIYAYSVDSIAITGSGVLDFTNTASWNVFGGNAADDLYTFSNANTPVLSRTLPSGDTLPVAMIEPYNSTNVVISGVTLRNASWTQIHPTICTEVTIIGVTTDASTPAISLESDVNVVVENDRAGHQQPEGGRNLLLEAAGPPRRRECLANALVRGGILRKKEEGDPGESEGVQ
jgi:polygalacturonase